MLKLLNQSQWSKLKYLLQNQRQTPLLGLVLKQLQIITLQIQFQFIVIQALPPVYLLHQQLKLKILIAMVLLILTQMIVQTLPLLVVEHQLDPLVSTLLEPYYIYLKLPKFNSKMVLIKKSYKIKDTRVSFINNTLHFVFSLIIKSLSQAKKKQDSTLLKIYFKRFANNMLSFFFVFLIPKNLKVTFFS